MLETLDPLIQRAQLLQGKIKGACDHTQGAKRFDSMLKDIEQSSDKLKKYARFSIGKTA